ncbi:MAG: S8 family serine peptidase [Oscillospiraceae bacterium]|nr:S8 family serine peptidase [Oscillospiraceae bacterium]
MKNLIKTLISAAAVLALAANTAFAAVPKNAVLADEDETVTFIVQVEGDALLATQEAAELGTDYLKTDEAEAKETALLKTQSQVLGKIQSKAKVESGVKYTYTAVLNGFAIDAPKSKLEEIKAIDGVKNVTIAKTMEVNLATSVERVSSLPSQTADDYASSGYTGDGQVIAIIDSEFDVGHEFFATAPENPKLSKSDIAEVIDSGELNVDVAANQVYKSAKIPFAYDYVNGTADTYTGNEETIHGTHVAGIAAGNGGKAAVTTENGEETEIEFSGVAPEAQLVLMKISNADGSLDESAAIAALDDAAKIGVCAVNMSFGAVFASEAVQGYVYDEVFATARKAGIMILVSEGNSGIGYDMYTADTSTPDYSSLGSPASNSAATAVASFNNSYFVSSMGLLTAADGEKMYYENMCSSSTFDTDFAGQTLEYVYCGLGYAEDFENVDVNGKIALIARGENTFAEKTDNAKAAGAAAAIIYNTSDGVSNFIETDDLSLSTVMIEKTAGEALRDAETKTVKVSEITKVYSKTDDADTVSYFTSLGVDETLELKPEIMAPGGHIFSSVPNDEYNSLSGTSMAAPHMTGVAALMNEYLDKSGSTLAGEERVSTLENMLMSSADIINQAENTDGEVVPHSPRVQGAGLVNTAAAMKTPAIFIGDSGKSKISLGDKIDDSFTLDFTVKNITNTDVTYDSVSLDVLTDGYQTDEDGNTYVVPDNAVRLKFESDLPSEVTVPANGEVSLSVNVTLDSDELAKNSEIFTNGFYIDGYVTLAVSGESDIPTISMPFTGFRGDWTSQPIFDKTMYDEGGSDLVSLGGTYLYTKLNIGELSYYYDLGESENDEYDKDKIAISPDGDGIGDALGLVLTTWRAVKNLTMEFVGEGVDVEQSITNVYPKYNALPLDFTEIDELDEESLPDGEYTFIVSGEFNYEGAETESFELPVTVDRVNPKITDVSIDGDTLSVTASDNNYLNTVDIYYFDENDEYIDTSAYADTEKGGEYTAEFDISGWDTDKIIISASDYAMNTTEVELSNALGKLIANMTDYETVGNMTTAAIGLTNSNENDIAGDAILAFYDEDGALIAASIQKISISAGDMAECKFDMFDDTASAAAAKLFIWDSVSGMMPVDSLKVFDLVQE